MVSWKKSAIFIFVVLLLFGLCAVITSAIIFWVSQSPSVPQVSSQVASPSPSAATISLATSPARPGVSTPTRISLSTPSTAKTPVPETGAGTATLTPSSSSQNTPANGATPTAYPTNTLGPSTPSPTPAPTLTPGIWKACENARESRLYKGMKASVSTDPPLPNRVRNAAGLTSSFLGLIEPGEEVDIVDGPLCSDNMVWWKVDNRKGLIGWTSEGDLNSYWLVPVLK